MCSVLLNVCDDCNPGLTVWLKRSTASEGMRDFLWPISFCRVLIPVFYQKAFDNTVVNSECVCVLYCMRMGQWCMEIRGLLFSCICPIRVFSPWRPGEMWSVVFEVRVVGCGVCVWMCVCVRACHEWNTGDFPLGSCVCFVVPNQQPVCSLGCAPRHTAS